MKTRTILLIVFLLLIVLFAAVNWAEFTRPAELSLLVATIQAPLGVVMLGLTIVLTGVFIAYALYLQTTMLLEARRHTRELQTQRELADHAEVSRITELRNLMTAEMRNLMERSEDAERATMERLERLERHLVNAFEESGNSVAATIGELDDRIVRQGTGASDTTGPGVSPTPGMPSGQGDTPPVR